MSTLTPQRSVGGGGEFPAVPVTVVAGPTAVGKGTVCAALRKMHPEIVVSVSATTRSARPGEDDGVHYHFVSDEEFTRLVEEGQMLEWATVHGQHRYGTPRSEVERARLAGRPLLLEIDVEGARQVRASMPEALQIFLAPPSWDDLVTRLAGRGTEDADERERRLRTARVELAAQGEFDEVVVNDVVDDAALRIAQLMGLGS